MKRFYFILIPLLLLGCNKGENVKNGEDECWLGGDSYLCDPLNRMQVVYSIENTTSQAVILGMPNIGDPGLLPGEEGSIPHHNVGIDNLENAYFLIPAYGTYSSRDTAFQSQIPPSHFTASVLFTEDVLLCLTDDALKQTPFTDEVYYDLTAGQTLVCPEDQLVSLLIDYFVITEDNFLSLSEQAAGRPFTLTYTDETVKTDDESVSHRKITYHYQIH